MKRFSVEELEGRIAIDRNDLDRCCTEQPELFRMVADELALAISERDDAKSYLKEIEADVGLRIRQIAEESNHKATVGEISDGTTIHSDVKAAKTAYLNWERSVNKISGLKESFSQRSYMLTQLVTLYVAGYYGDIQPRKAATNMREARADDGRERLKRARLQRSE